MTVFFAHRGLTRHNPENSIPAFRAALEAADGIELDVRLAKCGTPVVAHDDDLQRIYGLDAHVNQLTANELRELKTLAQYDSGESNLYVPTLEEVLQIIPPNFELNVEIKAPRVALKTPTRAVAEVLSNFSHNPLISSFNPVELARMSAYRRNARLALLFAPESSYALREGLAAPLLNYANLEAIHPNYKLVSIDLIERAHAKGWNVNVWTVNDPTLAEWLVSSGVDGLISDDVEELRAAIA